MIYTTYFARLKDLPSNVIPVSICGKAPDWYTGAQYKVLAPKYEFFQKWKETHDNDYYVERYKAEVLDNLDPCFVLNDLKWKLPNDIRYKLTDDIEYDKNYHIALVCYEKPGDFCHRHLVADWFQEYWVDIKEFEFNLTKDKIAI